MVTFNSGATVQACLGSLVGVPDLSVVVVDNASVDDTVELASSFPVHVEALRDNRGFSHGNNVGVALGHAAFVLFLNPDATIDAASVRRLVEALETEPVGRCQLHAILADSSSSAQRFPRLGRSFPPRPCSSTACSLARRGPTRSFDTTRGTRVEPPPTGSPAHACSYDGQHWSRSAVGTAASFYTPKISTSAAVYAEPASTFAMCQTPLCGTQVGCVDAKIGSVAPFSRQVASAMHKSAADREGVGTGRRRPVSADASRRHEGRQGFAYRTPSRAGPCRYGGATGRHRLGSALATPGSWPAQPMRPRAGGRDGSQRLPRRNLHSAGAFFGPTSSYSVTRSGESSARLWPGKKRCPHPQLQDEEQEGHLDERECVVGEHPDGERSRRRRERTEEPSSLGRRSCLACPPARARSGRTAHRAPRFRVRRSQAGSPAIGRRESGRLAPYISSAFDTRVPNPSPRTVRVSIPCRRAGPSVASRPLPTWSFCPLAIEPARSEKRALQGSERPREARCGRDDQEGKCERPEALHVCGSKEEEDENDHAEHDDCRARDRCEGSRARAMRRRPTSGTACGGSAVDSRAEPASPAPRQGNRMPRRRHRPGGGRRSSKSGPWPVLRRNGMTECR